MRTQSRRTGARTIPIFAIALMAIAGLYIFDLNLIYREPVFDYDTIEIIRGSIFKDRQFKDIAHPYVHEALKLGIISFMRLGVSGKLGYMLLIAGALTLNLISLACALGLLGVPWGQRAIAMALYLSAQTTIDIAARAEENLVHDSLYIWCITAFIRLMSDSQTRRRILAASLNTVSGILHMNPFLLIVGSEAVYLTSAARRDTRSAENPERRSAIFKSFRSDVKYCCAVPVLLVVLFFILAGVRIEPYGFLRPDSIASFQGNLAQWTRVYFVGAYNFVVLNLGQGLPALAAGVGMVALCGTYLVLLARRGSFPGCFGLTCLGFLYVFEPMSSERWDPFVVGLIIALAVHRTFYANLRKALMLILLVPFPLRAYLYTWFPCKERMWLYNEFNARSILEKRELHRSIWHALNGRDAIYALPGKPTLHLVFNVPSSVHVLPASCIPQSRSVLFYSRDERELEEMRKRYRAIEADKRLGLYELIPRCGIVP